jgi:hypothetical protein
MEMTSYISHPRDLVLPFVLALVFSTIGWLGSSGQSTFLETVPTLGVLLTFFAIPGGLTAAIVAGGFRLVVSMASMNFRGSSCLRTC